MYTDSYGVWSLVTYNLIKTIVIKYLDIILKLVGTITNANMESLGYKSLPLEGDLSQLRR